MRVNANNMANLRSLDFSINYGIYHRNVPLWVLPKEACNYLTEVITLNDAH